MRRFLTYLICSIFVLAFVFASVAVPAALLKAHETDILNLVTVVQADETDQKYLSQAVSFSEQVESFFGAELATKIARSAYPSELSMEEILEKTRIFLQGWLSDLGQEIWTQTGMSISAADVVAKSDVDAVLYESPSGSAKIPYWQMTYQWKSSDISTEMEWPIAYVTVYCDTATGDPYCIDYYYYPFVSFSDTCGVAALAEALKLEDQLDIDRRYEVSNPSEDASYEGAIDDSAAIWAAKVNTYFPLGNQEYSIVKSIFIDGDGHESLQLVPNYMIGS